jgi:hypothetical protein
MGEGLQRTDDYNKNVLFLLSAIGIYKQRIGITWYQLEQQFIRFDFRIAKLSHGEAYGIIDELNLVDYQDQELEDSLPRKMVINSKGEDFLKNHKINIYEIRNRVFSMDDVKSELISLEKFIYGN